MNGDRAGVGVRVFGEVTLSLRVSPGLVSLRVSFYLILSFSLKEEAHSFCVLTSDSFILSYCLLSPSHPLSLSFPHCLILRVSLSHSLCPTPYHPPPHTHPLLSHRIPLFLFCFLLFLSRSSPFLKALDACACFPSTRRCEVSQTMLC